MTSNLPLTRGLLAGTAIAITLGAVSALAQETTNTAADQTTSLDTITVEAAGDLLEAQSPLTQTTGRAEIEERMITSFQDFSRRVDAGVNFNTQDNSINIRGLQADRVLTTLDGIRVPWLNDPRSSTIGLNTFDFDSLSAIDVTKGTDSSRYGSGALGGVVGLRTLNPEDLIAEGQNHGALVKSTYDSTDRGGLGNAAVAGRFNDTWLLLQGGYKNGQETDTKGDVGGYGPTRTEANPADFDQGNVLAKLHQYIDGGHRIGLTGEIFSRDEDIDNRRGTTGSYVPGSLESGEDIRRQRLSASYDFISPEGNDWLDQASIVTYWQKQRINKTTDAMRVGLPSGVFLRDNLLDQTSYGINGDAAKAVELGGIEHSFRFGGELYGDKMHQYSWGRDNCPSVGFAGPCQFLHTNASDMPDVNSAALGLYVEDDISLLDARLTLTPGLRFDWFRHSPQSTAAYERSPSFDQAYLNSTSDYSFSPKLRAAWQASSELELFAQWAQGFRAPSATELYQNYGAPGSYLIIGNPNLKPETSNGFEVGANYESDAYTVSANVFNNYYRNFIDSVSFDGGAEFPFGITKYTNLARVQIYGVELAGEWRFTDEWRTWASIAWAHGKDTDTDQYLNSVAPLRAIVGLGYATDTWGSDVSLTAAGTRNKVSDGGFKAPGYGIVDATAWWEPEQVAGLRVRAGVFNIFDKTYWDAISVPDNTAPEGQDFYTEPGRTFRLSLTKTF
ncbi:TonB-dependent hemoglobin/transferrin/lactoferrin family receptor [Mycoplana ramosa]|uniref:TonB-dependent hemoglobin/transferrin/lactoferrin family receptor n=1 Tax=Mycoplana ramosa TaxID=40837 RepID=A0ABW3Z012_MYCRA